MAYQVLARKWRPQTFADVVGQDHVVRTLTNAINRQRIAHAQHRQHAVTLGRRQRGQPGNARQLGAGGLAAPVVQRQFHAHFEAFDAVATVSREIPRRIRRSIVVAPTTWRQTEPYHPGYRAPGPVRLPTAPSAAASGNWLM